MARHTNPQAARPQHTRLRHTRGIVCRRPRRSQQVGFQPSSLDGRIPWAHTRHPKVVLGVVSRRVALKNPAAFSASRKRPRHSAAGPTVLRAGSINRLSFCVLGRANSLGIPRPSRRRWIGLSFIWRPRSLLIREEHFQFRFHRDPGGAKRCSKTPLVFGSVAGSTAWSAKGRILSRQIRLKLLSLFGMRRFLAAGGLGSGVGLPVLIRRWVSRTVSWRDWSWSPSNALPGPLPPTDRCRVIKVGREDTNSETVGGT
jgi:hypothetical protein